MTKTYNFNDIILSDDKYNNCKKELTKEIQNNINHRRDVVDIILNNDTYEMNKGNLLTLLILALPFNKYKKEFNEDFLIDPSDLSEYEKYFDKIINYFIEEFNIKVNSSLVKIIDELTFVSSNMNLKYGATISLKSIIELEKRNDRFREILHMVISPEDNLNPDEIMKLTNDNLKEMINIILEDEEYNDLKNYLAADAGINTKQLGQVLSYIALKPDFNENIIPVPINTSFARGLKDVEEFYINAVGARKSLITSHRQVRSSGYLTRKLSLLTIDEFINDVEDCGTSQLMPIEITNKNILKLLNNRWFENDDNELELIDSNNTDLIGKTIRLRSPITCACKKGICHTCYGELYKINKDMNIGIIATLLLTNPLTQRLLSSKHLLQANIDKIEWSKDILKYFIINEDQISINDKINIEIYKEDITDDDDTIAVEKLIVIDKDKEIEIEPPVIFNINRDIIDDNNIFDENKNCYTLTDKILKNYDYVFYFMIENNGLSASLLKIKDLIENDRYIKEHDIFDIYKYFVSLIDESKININLIHIEVIIKQMLFFINDNREELVSRFPEYKVYNISNAIQYGSKSISKTLVFEYIYKQLTTDTYNTLNKNEESVIDLLLN